MDTKLQEYAKLLIEVGLNVQKGQTLIISSPVECASFARLCADAAYDAGCREVIMNWSDDYLSRQKFLRADASVFDDTPEWREKFFTSYAEMGAAYLAIAASDPETLKGVDPDRLVRSQKSGSVLRKTFDRLQMSNGFPWCIASVPIPSWAATVFPELPEDQALPFFNGMELTGNQHSGRRHRRFRMASASGYPGPPEGPAEQVSLQVSPLHQFSGY